MMTSRRLSVPARLGLFFVFALAAGAAPAAAQEATWRLEQPSPPPPPPGVSEAPLPIPLGEIGDVEFWAPNRGLLITRGNEPTIPPSVWAYNGVEWHELASVCGATAGSIAWAAPGEFWTISDGRAGQANVFRAGIEEAPPLEDDTLCHFAGGQVVASYAHPAFEADSYQAMHGAACIGPTDCWFGGEALPEPQIGAFHLHWNGSSLEAEPYPDEGHAVEDMQAFEGHLYEGVRIAFGDPVLNREQIELPALHRINPEGVQPAFQPERGLPLYGADELAEALGPLRLSGGAGAMWAAAGAESAESGEPGQVTVVRRVGRNWSQLIGPEHPLGPILPSDPAEEQELLGGEAKTAPVSAIAAEPSGGDAWLALAPVKSSSAEHSPDQRAVLVRVSPEGAVLGEVTLPTAGERAEGVGPKGAAAKLTCPAAGDCWLTTTRGWLFHLAPEGQRTLPRDQHESEYFTGLITYRPPDQGLPQVAADAPPPDDSGLTEEAPDYGGTFAEAKVPAIEVTVKAPLLSDLHSRLVDKTTLELRFRLAVKARVRLIATRKRKTVAETPMRTLQAGNRKLLLRLNRRDWPTKLALQTHALAPLPATTVKEPVGGPEHGGAGSNTVSTGLNVLPQVPPFAGLGLLP